MTDPTLPDERCDIYLNGSAEECGGPMFTDPQPEVTLRVCAFHTLLSRNYWMNKAEGAATALRQLEQERDEAHDEIGSMDAAIVYLRSRITELEGALRDVVAKWDEVLPHIQGAEGMAYVHGWQYRGPDGGMKPMMDAARAALLSPKSEE